MEVIRHILPQWPAAASTLPPTAAPLPAYRRGCPLHLPSLPLSLSSSLHTGHSVEPVAGRWRSLSRPLPKQAVSGSSSSLELGDQEAALREMVTTSHPTPEEGRVENLLFNFVSVLPKFSIKEQYSFISGSQEGAVRRYALPSSSTFLIASGQQCEVQGRYAFLRNPGPTVETVKCCSTHSVPTLGHYTFQVGSLQPTSLPHLRVCMWCLWSSLYSLWEPG